MERLNDIMASYIFIYIFIYPNIHIKSYNHITLHTYHHPNNLSTSFAGRLVQALIRQHRGGTQPKVLQRRQRSDDPLHRAVRPVPRKMWIDVDWLAKKRHKLGLKGIIYI